MTLVVKSFLTIPSLIDNDKGAVAPIGELSSTAKTFNPDVHLYQGTTTTDYDINIYTTRDNDGLDVLLPTPDLLEHTEVCDWIVDGMTTGLFNASRDDFLVLFAAKFSQYATLFDVGEMVPSIGYSWVPTWIMWEGDDDGIRDNNRQHKVWLSNVSFEETYDETVIYVLPAHDPLDFLQGDYATVGPVLLGKDQQKYINDVFSLMNGTAATKTSLTQAQWNDKSDEDAPTVTSYWYCAVYGPAHNDQILLNEKIASYILANSSFGIADWIKVLPSIFNAAEFFLCPHWNKVAISSLGGFPVIYHPSTTISELDSEVKDVFVNVSDNHYEDNLEVVGSLYFSLALSALGTIGNVVGNYRITDKYEDYILVPTDSEDFKRISPPTQDFILLLNELLMHADNYRLGYVLPALFNVEIRGSYKYISSLLDSTNYLVVTRESYLKQHPLVPAT